MKNEWVTDHPFPYVWIGCLYITWNRPYLGHHKDVEDGKVSRFYWPYELRVQVRIP